MGNRISSAVSVTSKLKRRDNGSVIDMLTEAQLDEFREAFNSFDKVCAGCGLLLSTSHWEEMTLAVRAHAKERGLRLACVRALDVISFGRLAHTPRALAQNGGGSIDARELKELMVSAGQNPTDEELEEMIRIADADGTGDIDFAEFVTLMAHRIADEKSEETLRAAFSVFDTSGDGFINAEEMRRIMMHMGEPVTLDDVDQVIRKVDRDGDGVIDYNEFTKVTPPPSSTSLLQPQRVLGAPSCAGVASVRRGDVADAADSCGCARLTGHHGRGTIKSCSQKTIIWMEAPAPRALSELSYSRLSLLEQLEGCQDHFQHIHCI